MPRPNFKTLNLDTATYDLLTQLARQQDRTMIAVLRRALSLYAQSN